MPVKIAKKRQVIEIHYCVYGQEKVVRCAKENVGKNLYQLRKKGRSITGVFPA